MALSTTAKNRMLNTMANYLDRIYLFSAAPTLDSAISGYTTTLAGYTSTGDRYVAMSWGTASGGQIVSSNAAASTPIMFAVPSGKTLSNIAYVDTASGNIIAIFTVSGSYTSSDGAYYISYETFSFA